MSADKDFKFKNLPKAFYDRFKALTKEFNVLPQTVTPVVTPAPVVNPPAKFGEGKLQDGTVIKWEGDQIAEGSGISVVDPANPGGFLPAPDGSYTLENGTTFEVKDGKATNVVAAAPQMPATPDMPGMMAKIEKLQSELDELKTKFSKVTDEKEASEKAFTAQTEASKKESESVRNQVKQLFELIGEMIEVPVDNPIQVPNNAHENKKDKLFKKIHS